MYAANTPPSIQDTDLRPALYLLVLCMALIEFGQVWFFDASQHRLITERAFGGQYRALLWLSSLGVIALHLLRGQLVTFASVLAPHLTFMAWAACVSVLWSVSNTTSVRTLIFWAFAAGVAASAGLESSQKALARTVATLFITVAAASLLLAIFVPSAAIAYWYDQPVVRGLFPQKNAFGWFAAMGLVWMIWLRPLIPLLMLLPGLAILTIALLVSGSAAALALAVAVNAYILWCGIATRLFANGALAFVATFLMIVAGLGAAYFTLPILFEAMGRDITLTGRTSVWAHYLGYISDRPLTGFGPGLFTGTGALAVAVGNTIPGFEGEGLFSTHSVYISILGETGPIGLALFVGAIGYLALIVPFRSADRWSHLAAGYAFAILIIGIAETRDGHGPGIATILLLTARAQSFNQSLARAEAQALAAQDQQPADLATPARYA